MVIKAQSPANFAEEYLIDNIWNNHFPAGTKLPSERELSELIGITRTTLREVLQRLARDGWLTIQHGKPTKVNNIWETSSLNLLETLDRLEHESRPKLMENLLSVRTNISAIFIKMAFKNNPQQAQNVLAQANNSEENAKAYTELDYHIFRGLAFASGNMIYGLIFNGLKDTYMRIGLRYFSHAPARQLAYQFYRQLSHLCQNQEVNKVFDCVRQYGKESGLIWKSISKSDAIYHVNACR